MEQSDKVGPAADDALKDPRVVDQAGYKHAERPEDDEGRGGGVSRSEVARFLSPSAFPAGREALLSSAEDNNAPAVVRNALYALQPDRTYATVQEVWDALAS